MEVTWEGSVTHEAPIELPRPSGITFDPIERKLYTYDTQFGFIFSIEPQTRDVQAVAPVPFVSVADLAFNPSNGDFYLSINCCINPRSDFAIIVDPISWNWRAHGTVRSTQGCVYVPNLIGNVGGVLFKASRFQSYPDGCPYCLVFLNDLNDRASTRFSPEEFGDSWPLVYDSVGDQLYAIGDEPFPSDVYRFWRVNPILGTYTETEIAWPLTLGFSAIEFVPPKGPDDFTCGAYADSDSDDDLDLRDYAAWQNCYTGPR